MTEIDGSLTVEELENGSKILQYKFNEVVSGADVIYVNSGGTRLFTFNAQDYGEDFMGLSGQRFNLDFLDCSDLSALNVIGNYDYKPTYSEIQAQAWKEYSANKIGSNHFATGLNKDLTKTCGSNNLYYDTFILNENSINNKSPLKIYNQGNYLVNGIDVSNFVKYTDKLIDPSVAGSYVKADFEVYAPKVLEHEHKTELNYSLLDFSNISFDNVIDYKYVTLNKSYGAGENNIDVYNELLFDNDLVLKYTYIWPDINNIKDKSFKYANGSFAGALSLSKTPLLPNTIIEMTNTFKDCISIKTISNIPINVENLTNTFKGCISIIDVSDLVIPGSAIKCINTFEGTNITRMPVFTDDGWLYKYFETFKDTKIETVDLDNFPKTALLDSVFKGTTTIKNIEDFTFDLTEHGQFSTALFDNDMPIDSIGIVNIKGFNSFDINNEYSYNNSNLSSPSKLNSGKWYTNELSTKLFSFSENIPAKIIKAWPFHLLGDVPVSTPLEPQSDGFDWWYDSYSGNSDYVHSIVLNRLPTSQITLNTVKNRGKFTISLSENPIQLFYLDENYPYGDIEIVSVQILEEHMTGKQCDVHSNELTLSEPDNGWIKEIIIEDNKIVEIKTNYIDGILTNRFIDCTNEHAAEFDIAYTIMINGHEFNGKAKTYLPYTIYIDQKEIIEIEVSTATNNS